MQQTTRLVCTVLMAGVVCCSMPARHHQDTKPQRVVHGPAFYHDGPFYHDHYFGFKMRHAAFPVRYEDGIKLFGGVLVDGERVGPHVRISAWDHDQRVLVYWPWPYRPEQDVTYPLPGNQRPVTCNGDYPCYDYWDWHPMTVSIIEDPNIEAVYDDQR
jgi:hypothetical protein